MSNWQTCRFSAVDTFFFKEARQLDTSGETKSLFPPPINTLMGALRSAIGEARDVNWLDYGRQKHDHPVADEIGYGEDTGPLRFRGPWLVANDKRLYPIPAAILCNPSAVPNKVDQFAALKPGAPMRCDLGLAVRMAQLPDHVGRGFKSLANAWVEYEVWEQLAAGIIPDGLGTKNAAIYRPDDFYTVESRLGIARDNATSTIKHNMLYQTQHLRANRQRPLSFEIDVDGLPVDALPETNILRLGGEGRMANMDIFHRKNELGKPPNIEDDAKGIVLNLLTPAQLDSSGDSPLPGFQRTEQSGSTVWTGRIGGVELTLHSVITKSPLRIGGWDLANNRPKAVHSLSAPGSCWYMTCANLQAAATTLHGQLLGEGPSHQRGVVAISQWLK